jgi:hypothetical protein
MEFGAASCKGAFLSTVLSEWCIGGGFLGFPGKSTGRPFGGRSRGANSPHGLVVRSPSSLVSSFIRVRFLAPSYSDSAAALKEEAIKAMFSSPPHRRLLSPEAYTHGLPTVGRSRASPVRLRTFAPGGRMYHPLGPSPASASPSTKGSGVPSASSESGDWRASEAEVQSPGASLPGPFATASSPESPVTPPWLRTPAEVARFEQRFLNGCGPAQVGFGACSSFLYLSVCSRDFSRGKLSPEPCGSRTLRVERMGRPPARLGESSYLIAAPPR